MLSGFVHCCFDQHIANQLSINRATNPYIQAYIGGVSAFYNVTLQLGRISLEISRFSLYTPLIDGNFGDFGIHIFLRSESHSLAVLGSFLF